MTDSPTGGLSTSRNRLWTTHTTTPNYTREQRQDPFSAFHSVRRPASASRTYGRYAVDPSNRQDLWMKIF
jgi:hypothetical protein